MIAAGALVNLYTGDIQTGLRFYRYLLGFTETFRTPTEGVPEHVELRSNGFTLGLGTVEAARRVHGVEAAPGSPAMVLVVWTDDLDAAYGHLMAAGVPVVQPPHNTGNNSRNALLRDPDGNLVELVAKAFNRDRVNALAPAVKFDTSVPDGNEVEVISPLA